MFGFLFHHHDDLMHNKGKVKKWEGEHKALAKEAMEVVRFYDNNDMSKAKKHLIKLQNLALNHLMDEDVTFFELFKKADDSETDKQIMASIKEFRSTFIDTKKALIHFFIHYTDKSTVLDANFKEQLDGIIAALVQRIEFEEKNLYTMINK